MNKKGGGPFMALINSRLNAIEYAYQRRDYVHAISALRGLGVILGVKLPAEPYYNKNQLIGHSVALKQKVWIDDNFPSIDSGVAEWMKRMNKSGIRIVEEGEGD